MHYCVYVLVKPEKPPWYIGDVEGVVKEALEPHRERDVNPDDDESGLTGEWDWFALGGRWTGNLDCEYSPELDPRNYTRCSRAGCRAKPFSGEQFSPERFDKNQCPQCYGTGLVLRWPTSWIAFDRDVVKASVARSRIARYPEKAPHTLVANGAWLSHNLWDRKAETFIKTPEREWLKIVDAALDVDDGWYVVVVDCHS